jgi:hypothetical protein
MLIDTYLSSPHHDTLSSVCAAYPNVIGPLPGRAAEGDQPAAGDPALWYAVIRRCGAVDPPEGASLCDEAIVTVVLGVWAD